MDKHIIIEPLTLLWWAGLCAPIVLITMIIVIGKRSNEATRLWIEKFTGVGLLGTAILIHPYLIATGNWEVSHSLPLHICHITGLLSGIALFWRNQRVYEVLLFFGVPGGIHSILTPELPHGLDTVFVLEYFISHGGIILVPLYLTWVRGMRPGKGSWWQVFLGAQLLLPFIFLANWLSGGNYWYVSRKPLVENPFLIGDWPWYIFVVLAVGLVHFLIVYFPFWVESRLKGKMGLKQLVHTLPFMFRAILGAPVRILERILYGRKIRQVRLERDPVFILGHWRSGTTYLHQLMAANPDWHYLNFYRAGFPTSWLLHEKWFKPILQWVCTRLKFRIPYFNGIAMDFDFPCEEDTALINAFSSASAYWAYQFPRQARAHFQRRLFAPSPRIQAQWANDYMYLVKKLSLHHRGKQLVLKCPANTARIAQLLKLFPNSKFVYLHRTPEEVLRSHQKLWQENIRLFAFHSLPDEEIKEVVRETHHQLLTAFEAQKPLIPADRLVEVRYAQLKAQPQQTVEAIYAALSLEGLEDFQPILKAKVQELAGYREFTYAEEGALAEKVTMANSTRSKTSFPELT